MLEAAFPDQGIAAVSGFLERIQQQFTVLRQQGVEKPLRRTAQLVLLDADETHRAFGHVEEAEFAGGIALQVEYQRGQIGCQGPEARLAVMQHFQRRAMVGTLAGFAHFALDCGRQASEPVGKHHVMGAGMQGLDRRTLVVRRRDDDQRRVEIPVAQGFQHAGRRAADLVETMQDGIPALFAQLGAQGGQAGGCHECRFGAFTLPVLRQLLDHGRCAADDQQAQGGFRCGGCGLHEIDRSGGSGQL